MKYEYTVVIADFCSSKCREDNDLLASLQH